MNGKYDERIFGRRASMLPVKINKSGCCLRVTVRIGWCDVARCRHATEAAPARPPSRSFATARAAFRICR